MCKINIVTLLYLLILLLLIFKNHTAERIWVEMNARVNYPVKKILNALVNEENIDMDDEATKFCVSWFTSRVCHVGSRQVIDAWNSHSIPGKPESVCFSTSTVLYS